MRREAIPNYTTLTTSALAAEGPMAYRGNNHLDLKMRKRHRLHRGRKRKAVSTKMGQRMYCGRTSGVLKGGVATKRGDGCKRGDQLAKNRQRYFIQQSHRERGFQARRV